MSGEEKAVSLDGVTFSHADIFCVVDDFYTRVQHDTLLQVPFQSVTDWPEHIQRLTHFWWIRFGGEPYLFAQYNPIAKHFAAGFNRELLIHWLSIFHSTIKTHLTPQQTDLWTEIASRMGANLLIRNDFLKNKHDQR